MKSIVDGDTGCGMRQRERPARVILRGMTVLALCAAVILVSGCISETGHTPAVGEKGAQVRFTKGPTVQLVDDSIQVAFAVDRETDVTVAIKDCGGRTVRHLAAGVLGGNPPRPLKAGSLEQLLSWDRKDDQGRPVPSGKYSVEVALGLEAGAVRTIGWMAGELGELHGIAMATDGTVTTLSRGDVGFARIQRFDSQGAYVATLVPRSSQLPLERTQALGEMVLNGGRRIPRELMPQYGGDSTQSPLGLSNGDVIFVNGRAGGHAEGHRYHSSGLGEQPPRRLLRLAKDGGVPEAGYLGPVLGKGFEKSDLHLAMTRDEKDIYVSGARHAVFRVQWGEDAAPKAVIGVPDTAGSGDKLKDPQGISIDEEGHIYVADRGNHRVAKFSPEGKLLGETPVKWPRQALVDPRTGVLYVVQGYKTCSLLKFKSVGDKEPMAILPLRGSRPLAALDTTNSKPLFYVANIPKKESGSGRTTPAVVRIVDKGRSFKEMNGTLSQGEPLQPFLMGADPVSEQIYLYPRGSVVSGYVRINGRTGEREDVPMPVHPKANQISEVAVGPTGDVAFHVRKEIGRVDASLSPSPFFRSGTHIARLPEEDSPRSNFDRGVCVAPNGDIYWIHERGGYGKFMRCSAIHADGSLKKDTLIFFESGSPASIRVDRDGYVYVLDHLKPTGTIVPAALLGKIPGKDRHDRFVYNYGSILKFKPEGGKVTMISKERGAGLKVGSDLTEFTTAEGRGLFKVEGLVWSRFGASMIQPALDRSAQKPYCCQCWAARFDMDGFARLFVPDQLQCRISILDSNGNLVTRIGQYGNVDDAGMSMADPRTVMVTDEGIYVGDIANHRILRAALRYSVQESRTIRIQAAADSTRLVMAEDKDHPYQPLAFEAHRLNAIWSRWDLPEGSRDRKVLKKALSDRSEKVRVGAAYVLLSSGDGAGLAEIFRAARSEDPDVYLLAETAILRNVVKWDSSNEKIKTIDPKTLLVPQFPIGKEEVTALIPLLDSESWFLNRVVILMLGMSGRPEAGEALLAKLRAGAFTNKNLNRALGSLGALRCRAAVPDLVKFAARGRAANHGTLEYNGDRAEQYAARALRYIADPASIEGLIDLLDSDKVNTSPAVLSALSEMFDPDVPEDCRVLPSGQGLIRCRVDSLPCEMEQKQLWQGYWKEHAGEYAWNSKESVLKKAKQRERSR